MPKNRSGMRSWPRVRRQKTDNVGEGGCTSCVIVTSFAIMHDGGS